MRTRNYVQRLWNYGYFYHPEVTKIEHITERDLPRLRLGDRSVSAAIKAYRRNFEHIERAIVDREKRGTSTVTAKMLIAYERCEHPDYTSFKELDLNNTYAAWPRKCRQGLTVYHDLSALEISPLTLHTWTVQAFENWSDKIDVGFKFGSNDSAHINLKTEELDKSVLANHQVSRGVCNQHLIGKFNTLHNWNNKGKFIATLTHELGHALGMRHIRNPDAIMNPVIHKEGRNRLGTITEEDKRGMLDIGYNLIDIPKPDPPKPIEPKLERVINSFRLGTVWIDVYENAAGTGQVIKWFKVGDTQCALKIRNQ